MPINDKRFYPIYAKCIELDIPICITTGVPGPRVPMACQKTELIDEVCWFFPELKFVMRHGAEPWDALAVKLMLKWPNLYYSTSAFAPATTPDDHRLRQHPRRRQGHVRRLLPDGPVARAHLLRAAQRAVQGRRVAEVPPRERHPGVRAGRLTVALASPPRRSPFPVPFGWFCVGYPEDFPAGEPKALFYFDRHLVAWRDESASCTCRTRSARTSAPTSATAARSRAARSSARSTAGGSTPRAPTSTSPTRSGVNKKGTLRTYPVVERNGLCFAWYHPDPEVAPMWEVRGPARVQRRPRVVHGHPHRPHRRRPWQEMAENGVDSAHFRFVHNTAEVPVMESYETGFPGSKMRSSQKFVDAPRRDGGPHRLRVHGPGSAHRALQRHRRHREPRRHHADHRDRCITRFNFRFKSMGDAETTRNVGQAFVREVDKQFLEDKPIWEHKAHLVRPALADNDGPFMKFRKWAAQFYAEGVSDERTVFPPPWWPDRADEAPAKATAKRPREATAPAG